MKVVNPVVFIYPLSLFFIPKQHWFVFSNKWVTNKNLSGKDSSEQEKVKGVEAAQEYLDSDPSERDSSTPIYKIQQGREPLSFKGFFMVRC